MISFFIIKISTFYNPGESRNVLEKKGVRKKIFENFFEKNFFFACLKMRKKSFFIVFWREIYWPNCVSREKQRNWKKKKKLAVTLSQDR